MASSSDVGLGVIPARGDRRPGTPVVPWRTPDATRRPPPSGADAVVAIALEKEGNEALEVQRDLLGHFFGANADDRQR